ncbi:efflux RND transporter permease subunit [Cyanobacterium aponinum AL20118]|uniref:Efflux RND transporter permease subunit n=1 Tax=Cyanobacterium aponinum AL20115 TaxID=3090662 RepID=A0AAF0Z6M0_9CHRO|nr:efflux RND transporter permease subunit [Cyanobacterium aponinum]WPF87136.1 efflux RND transporter permease subunit [Cyanobacterium aponinum AL20115]
MNFSWRQRLNISRFAIHHPRLTISFWLGIAIAGILAFSSLKYALFPDVTFPVVIIRASSDIVNPIENSDRITTILEKPLLSLEGVESVTSTTYPREIVINTLFFAGKTLEKTTNIVKETIAEVDLPANTKLEIIPYNLNESTAISYALTSENQNLEEIATIAIEEIIPNLEKIDGILNVNLLGLSEDSQEIKQDINPSIVNFNGESALALQVIKKGTGNTLEIVKKVKTAINQLQNQFADIQFNIAQTEANYIQEATQATIDSLILAIILAILVIFPFLNSFKATFITALAIPLSLLGTFIVMATASFNLETITLLALALVIGIVVDDAIVEVENISRHISEGETPKQAALKGSDEIGLTVSASTLTIVAVFLPVAFTTGNVKQFFLPFALTVSTAVVVSLLVARTLTPVLCMYWLKSVPKQGLDNLDIFNGGIKDSSEVKEEENPSLHREEGKRKNKFLKSYQKILHWSLLRRKVVIIFALLSFIIGIALIPLIPQGFIPQLDRGEFNVIYTTELPKLSLNLEDNSEANTIENQSNSPFNWIGDIAENPDGFILRRTRRAGDKIQEAILANPDVETVFNMVGLRSQPNRGRIYVKLKSDRQTDTITIQNQIRDSLPSLKGVNISVEDIKFIDTGDAKPFSFSLISENVTSLYSGAEKIKPVLEQISGLQDLSISPTDISISAEQNPQIIEHQQGKPSVTFTANLGEGEALGDLTKKIVNTIQPFLPADITLSIGGDSARMWEVLRQFSFVLGFSILLMLGVLWLLFGSLREPLVVGLSLPLSIVGAMLALLITQSDFGMISLIGFIFLLGLLDKNTLLLVDYINQLRQQGMNRQEAIIKGCTIRLRPILMTTLSTILGMLPIAIGLGAGAELRQPMAVAIIGGLITSSLLSLIFVPVFYSIMEDIWFKAKTDT